MLQVVILYDAIKTIQNVVFVFFYKKQNLFRLKKNQKRIKKTKKKKPGFSQPWLSFNPFLWFSLDHTIWSKSRHCQFDWVCATHLE